MAPSILKITAATSLPLRSIFRSPNSCRAARMISTVNKSDESRPSVLSSSSPYLMLSPHNDNTSYELYSFAEKKVLSIPKPDLKYEIESEFRDATKILGSSHGWLAYCNHLRGDGGELFLSNPISGRRVNLPPLDKISATTSDYMRLHERLYECSKIRMTCSDPESEEYRVVMKFDSENRLALCCPSSSEWTILGSDQARGYHDFVYCCKHELFFSLDFSNCRKLEAWDLKNPSSPSLVWSCDFNDLEMECDSGGEPPSMKEEIPEFSERQEYLVMSQQGDLFLVKRYINRCMLPDGSCAPIDRDNEHRYPAKTVSFDVYKIVRDGDDKGKKVLMDGHLDGLVMFVGDPSQSIAISSNDANGFKPNSICFTNDHHFFSSRHGTDNGIFDYKEKKLSSCYYPFDHTSLKNKIMSPPLWFSPN
ncbi:hypothetical protein CASFOL_008979 [Castilleja foliolosa]|uniref:KIB1-4 beta-propeller domain-containing protein n=1 Tax=Castilleja foliolosa TaxID=1961234 RepID=A0ABD3E4L9_9LAMI